MTEQALVFCDKHGKEQSAWIVCTHELGYEAELEAVDPRWMGAVFRRGWERVAWTSTGSHRRPVSVWRLINAPRVKSTSTATPLLRLMLQLISYERSRS